MLTFVIGWLELNIPSIQTNDQQFSELSATRPQSVEFSTFQPVVGLNEKNASTLKSALDSCKKSFTTMNYQHVVSHFFSVRITRFRDPTYKWNASKAAIQLMEQQLMKLKKSNPFNSSSILDETGHVTSLVPLEQAPDTVELRASSLQAKKSAKGPGFGITSTDARIQLILSREAVMRTGVEDILQLATKRWKTRSVKTGNLLLAATKLPSKQQVKENVALILKNGAIPSGEFTRLSILPSLALGLMAKWVDGDAEKISTDAAEITNVNHVVDTVCARWGDGLTGTTLSNAQTWFMFAGYYGYALHFIVYY